MSCKNYQFILSEQHVDGFYVCDPCQKHDSKIPMKILLMHAGLLLLIDLRRLKRVMCG